MPYIETQNPGCNQSIYIAQRHNVSNVLMRYSVVLILSE